MLHWSVNRELVTIVTDVSTSVTKVLKSQDIGENQAVPPDLFFVCV